MNIIRYERLILNARVAQSVERSAVNRKVGGSNPPVSDIFRINRFIDKNKSAIRIILTTVGR